MHLVQIDVNTEFSKLHKYFSEGRFPELINADFSKEDLQELKFQLSQYQYYMVNWYPNEVDLDKFNSDINFCLQYIDAIFLDVEANTNIAFNHTKKVLGIISLGGIVLVTLLLMFSKFPLQVVTTGDQFIVKKSIENNEIERSNFRNKQNEFVENYKKNSFS
jgi:hypothetical protein